MMSTFKREYNVDTEYKTCPYDANHRVPVKRLAIHMIKCEKQSDKVLMICPFNAIHRIPKQLFEQHLNLCENKSNIISKQVFDTESKTDTRIAEQKIDDKIDGQQTDEENWD